MGGYLSFDYARQSARQRLPGGLFEYIDRGVGEEASLAGLRQSLDRITVAPRVLQGFPRRDTACNLFDQPMRAPFIIAPTAMAGLIRHNGEVMIARAATRFGIPVSLSTQSVCSIDSLARMVPDAHIWMQLYLWQDPDLSAALLKRAWDAGSRILVMTTDTPRGARKEWNIRNGFDMPLRLGWRNLIDVAARPGWVMRTIIPALLRGGLPRLENYPPGLKPGLTGPPANPRVRLISGLSWDHVNWVRDRWAGRLILKGILTAEDAGYAARAGADGIVVSSHGARNCDSFPAPIDCLPDISAQAGDRLTILADSGIRRGSDVWKYLYAGAGAVMLGRLPLWALAAGGEDGVLTALEVLQDELQEAEMFLGRRACPGISESARPSVSEHL